jgi:hypothetical protein
LARRNRPQKSVAPSPPAAIADAPASADGQARRSAWLALGCVVLLLAAMYPEPMFLGQVYGSADTAAADAFRQVGDAARRDGVYPLWNPYIFGGLPSFGSLSYTHGVYPPTLLLEWLQRLGLPPLTWLLGHLLFGGLGMWWLLGRWQVPWPARAVGVVAWLWSARLVAWAVHGHGTKLGAEMYLPWLVGLVWQILTRGGLRPVAMAALLLGLQFLRGHLQISFYTLLVIGGLGLWHLARPLQGPLPFAARWRRFGLVLGACALGIMIGAVLLWPVYDYAAFSTRGEGGATGSGVAAFDYATAWSLGPEDLGAMILPAAAGFGKATYHGRMPFTDNPNYVGLLLPLLAAAAWLARGRRTAVWAFAAIGGLALLLAMGRFSPGVYQLFYAVVPYFDRFRVPSMILVLVFLVLAVLAALGAAALADPSADRARWLRRGAFALGGAGGVLLLLGVTGLAETPYREALAALAARAERQIAPVLLSAAWDLHRMFLVREGLVLLAAGGALLLAGRREHFRRVLLVPVLALLVAVDLWGVANLVTHPERRLSTVVRGPDGGGVLAPAAPLLKDWRGPAAQRVDPDLATALRATVGHGRLLPLGGAATSNDFMTAGVRSLGGYHPAKPAAAEAVRARLFGGVPPGMLARWLGASAVSAPERLTPGLLDLLAERGLDLESEGIEAGATWIYRLRDPLPRARLLAAYRLADDLPAAADLEAFLDAVAEGRLDPRRHVVLDRRPVPEPSPGPEPLPVPEFVRDGLNEVVLQVAAPRPAVLLLADLAAPGWRVTIDGRPAPLLRGDFMLRAVAVPAGRREGRFEFHDPALQRGLFLALAGLAGAAALLVAAWLQTRRLRPPTVRSVDQRDEPRR